MVFILEREMMISEDTPLVTSISNKEEKTNDERNERGDGVRDDPGTPVDHPLTIFIVIDRIRAVFYTRDPPSLSSSFNLTLPKNIHARAHPRAHPRPYPHNHTPSGTLYSHERMSRRSDESLIALCLLQVGKRKAILLCLKMTEKL